MGVRMEFTSRFDFLASIEVWRFQLDNLVTQGSSAKHFTSLQRLCLRESCGWNQYLTAYLTKCADAGI